MNLKFTKVDTKERFEEWKGFASEFNHESDAPYLPIVMVSEGDEIFGYWSSINLPVVMPAFHPDRTTPRRFKEMAEAVSNAHQIASLSSLQHPNGACYLALEESPAIDESIIEKLGFKPMNLKLWRKA